MKKKYMIVFIISIIITNVITYQNVSKADSGLQSVGKIVYEAPDGQGEDIIIDASDHTYLKNNINANGTNIAGLQNTLTSLQSQITSSQSQVTTLQSQVTTLQSQVTTLQNQVSTLQSSVSTLQTQVAAMQPKAFSYTAINKNFSTTQQSVSIPGAKGKTEAYALVVVQGAPYLSRVLHLDTRTTWHGAHLETPSGQYAGLAMRMDFTTGTFYYYADSISNLTVIMQGVSYR